MSLHRGPCKGLESSPPVVDFRLQAYAVLDGAKPAAQVCPEPALERQPEEFSRQAEPPQDCLLGKGWVWSRGDAL